MNIPNGTELRITVENGLVKVAAPTGTLPNGRQGFDNLTCYALLEAARDAIKDHNEAVMRAPIVQANGKDILEFGRKP